MSYHVAHAPVGVGLQDIGVGLQDIGVERDRLAGKAASFQQHVIYIPQKRFCLQPTGKYTWEHANRKLFDDRRSNSY